MGLIDEISIKRIHIKEKIRGHFLSVCLRSQWFITPSAVLILFETINVPMIVDASCRFLLLFLSGSSQESVLWRTLRWFVCRFFFSVNILYFWKLGQWGSWFPMRGCFLVQTELWSDRKHFCSYISLNTRSFQDFNFNLISITYMSRSVVAEISSWLWSIYCCNYFFHAGSRPGLQYFRSLFCGDTWIINEPVKDVFV